MSKEATFKQKCNRNGIKKKKGCVCLSIFSLKKQSAWVEKMNLKNMEYNWALTTLPLHSLPFDSLINKQQASNVRLF